MYRTISRADTIKVLFVWILMSTPALLFYALVLKNAVRIPILDDYDIILGSLNWISKHHGLPARLLFLLTAEHNGYKLMFENGVVLLEYTLVGKLYLLPLVLLGDAFPIAIFLAVIGMTRLSPEGGARNWLLLTPVAWIIFQLQYASALDFASSSLQHLAVIAFALISILLVTKAPTAGFTLSCAMLVLAIASSPNGFFVAPVGVLALLQYRRWRRLIVWSATTALMLAVYLFRYSPLAAGSGGGGEKFGHANALYAFSFLGASAARYSSIRPSVVLGLALVLIFIFAAQRRYFVQNPAVFYSMLFILINAVAVSGLRSDFGVTQSLASRYRTYSNLYLAFSYIFFVESLLPKLGKPAFRRGAVGGALCASIAFACLSDAAGARFLHGKKEALTANYRSQWQGKSTPVLVNPEEVANPALIRQIGAGVYRMNLPVFREAVENGIYTPPLNP